MVETVNAIGSFISDYILIAVLLSAAVYFTITTHGVQFRLIIEMFRLLFKSSRPASYTDVNNTESHHSISSFQAFMVSIASRVGTGNLAGVATAIAIGGPGAVFWMWIIAILGSASAFIESTLAQLYKIRGKKSFIGGPAYYISKGLGSRSWAVCFAILITLTFGLAFNSVQANTIADAFNNSFDVPPVITGLFLSLLTLIIIWGGIQSIARVSEILVPVMAIAYLLLAISIIIINIESVPYVLKLIVSNAFGFDQAFGATFGSAVILGTKRGLFSNEAGEGSAPNVAATASVSHPVKQGLIQSLGVLTDTLLICSCTAFIILCSGAYDGKAEGIALTQHAVDLGLGLHGYGSIFISVAIFFFAFTSIVANYYYGETNLRFICQSRTLINIYRIYIGSLLALWSILDLSLL